MGNQIIRAAHWLAWAMDYPDDIRLVNLAFWPYASSFQGTVDWPGCAYPSAIKGLDDLARLRSHLPGWFLDKAERRFQHLVHAVGAVLPGMQRLDDCPDGAAGINLDGDDFYQRVVLKRVTTCAGWNITGWSRVRHHQNELRAFFRPHNPVAAKAAAFVAGLRERCDRVVGVFIRQGDYMTWQGGRFGFSTLHYVRWMRQVLDIESGHRVCFLITSDTWQDPGQFAGLPYVFSNGSKNAGGSAITSFAEMSECDLILTPPSTFSSAAAFVGKCPLWPVVRPDQSLSSDQIEHNVLLDEAISSKGWF